MSARNAMIAKVKVAAKQLQIDEPTYRAMLERITGKTSAADCTEAQLGLVLDEFKAKGWRPQAPARAARRGGSSARQADHAAARKARAMWISLWNLGEVEDPSEAALEAFARRQLGGVRLQWADQGQTYKLIEALKAWAERAGWSQSANGLAPERQIFVLKLRLALAQADKLEGADHVAARAAVHQAHGEAALDRLITELGAKLRGVAPVREGAAA